MAWEKIENRRWQAQGEKGVFFIEQKGKTFWARYRSKSGFKCFTMPPQQKLSEAKAKCEDNIYWEDNKDRK